MARRKRDNKPKRKVTRHGGGNQNHKSHAKYKGRNNNKKPSISQLKKRGLDKSEIVARLTGTRNNSGGARRLTDKQLDAIGFSNRFINDINNRGDGKGTGSYKGRSSSNNNDNKNSGGNSNKSSGGSKGPELPSIQEFLMSDAAYQQGIADLEWALGQFGIENQAAQGDANAAFESAMARMNFDKGKDLEFLKNDFGSRGLVNSGLYPDAVSDYNTEFSMGVADLNRDLASQMRDLGFEQTNMQQNAEMSKRDLRLDAIRRRAEQVQSQQFNFGSKPGNGNKDNGGGSKIDRLQDKGLDKSEIVARLTGTKDNSGGARQLSGSQLRQIGFSNKFIDNLRGRDHKTGVRKRDRGRR